ncbi:MAG: protein kinase [Myxococcota bacterium]
MSAAQKAARPVLPSVGQVLDRRFELLGTLGSGGMGQVFRARDLRLGREVALKLIVPRYLGRPEREQRFLQELDLGRCVEPHRNLVDYLDGGRLHDFAWPFLVMELVPGRDLGSRLARGPLPPPEATRLARQVAGAVQALHRRGIAHRDVTPMNVLVADGNAVLIDLSHASEIAAPRGPSDGQQRLTRMNEVPGTPHFMAPEQARAEPARAAMDVYAFGVMLVHMLTGVAPGRCDDATFIELQGQGQLRPPRIDTRVYDAVPLALAELVDACVATEPQRRPTMDEVVRRLDEQLVVMTAAVESGEQAVAANEASVDSLVTTKPFDRHSIDLARPRRRVLLIVSVAVVVAAGALGWWLHSRSGSEERGVGVELAESPVTSPRAAAEPSRQPTAGFNTEQPPRNPPAPAEPVTPATEPVVIPPPTEAAPPSRPRRSKRRSQPHSASVPREVDPCPETLERASAARKARQWRQVAELTRTRRCWDDPVAYTRMRIKALSELGRFNDCVKLGEASADPEARRMAVHCDRQLDRGQP